MSSAVHLYNSPVVVTDKDKRDKFGNIVFRAIVVNASGTKRSKLVQARISLARSLKGRFALFRKHAKAVGAQSLLSESILKMKAELELKEEEKVFNDKATSDAFFHWAASSRKALQKAPLVNCTSVLVQNIVTAFAENDKGKLGEPGCTWDCAVEASRVLLLLTCQHCKPSTLGKTLKDLRESGWVFWFLSLSRTIFRTISVCLAISLPLSSVQHTPPPAHPHPKSLFAPLYRCALQVREFSDAAARAGIVWYRIAGTLMAALEIPYVRDCQPFILVAGKILCKLLPALMTTLVGRNGLLSMCIGAPPKPLGTNFAFLALVKILHASEILCHCAYGKGASAFCSHGGPDALLTLIGWIVPLEGRGPGVELLMHRCASLFCTLCVHLSMLERVHPKLDLRKRLSDMKQRIYDSSIEAPRMRRPVLLQLILSNTAFRDVKTHEIARPQFVRELQAIMEHFERCNREEQIKALVGFGGNGGQGG